MSGSNYLSAKYNVVVIGANAGGLGLIGYLLAKNPSLSIALIEDDPYHIYQDALPLVAAGKQRARDVVKYIRQLISRSPRLTWHKNPVELIDTVNRTVHIPSWHINYDYIVFAPESVYEFDKVKGLDRIIGTNGVCSTFTPQLAEYTYKCIETLKEGDVIFTYPDGPAAGEAATLSVMNMAAGLWKQHGRLHKLNISYRTVLDSIFSNPRYADLLLKQAEKYGIDLHLKHELLRIDTDKKEAVFRLESFTGEVKKERLPFNMLHVTPNLTTPNYLKDAKLLDDRGLLAVNKETMQHARVDRAYAVGEPVNIPTMHSAVAVKRQIPVIGDGILHNIDPAAYPAPAPYDGHTALPINTEQGRTIYAEFDYGFKHNSTFPVELKEQHLMWYLQTGRMPKTYWKKIITGKV